MKPILFLTLVALSPFTQALPLLQPPMTQPMCEDAGTIEVETVFTSDSNLENLAFDGNGGLFVTDLGSTRGAGRVFQFGLRGNAAGQTEIAKVAELDFAGTHGIVLGADCRMYLGAGRSESLGGEGPWQVWKSGWPVQITSHADWSVYAEGIGTVNGMAFDDQDNLYVSSPLARAPYIVKVDGPLHAPTPRPTRSWRDEIYGSNGLFRDGAGALFSAITGDQASSILRLPFDTGQPAAVVAELSVGIATLQPGVRAPGGLPTAEQPTRFAMVPKGLDDLTYAPDGMIYATGHISGELLRVNPRDGSACVLLDDLNEPTSVRIAFGFGAHDGDLFITDMGGTAVTALAPFGQRAGRVYRVNTNFDTAAVPGARDCSCDPLLNPGGCP